MKTNGEQIVATKKLGPLTYLGYAAGDAGNNLAFAMFGMFLLLYYTDVAGITAAAAGTLFLAVRAWDAFADIFAGRIVDRTSTRWGKFRPFLLFGSVPLLLLSMATFSVPAGWSRLRASYRQVCKDQRRRVCRDVQPAHGSFSPKDSSAGSRAKKSARTVSTATDDFAKSFR